jgi:hypothetical protein
MNKGSSIFIFLGATGLVCLLGLPLLLSPMSWARTLRWELPEQKALANYLGRSLGAVGLSIAVMGYLAARDPWQYRFVFVLVILLGIFLTVVHGYGFVKKSQPAFENIEAILFPLISLLAWYFYPHQP